MDAEEWREIDEFPMYLVSNHGNVMQSETRRRLKQTPVAYNIPTVGLNHEKKVYRRSVPLLVAKAFIPQPEPHYDTPIHFDGDRANCHVSNLAWRPRWFAVHFHRQLAHPLFPDWQQPIRLIETGEVFGSPREAAMKYGQIETKIVVSLTNRSLVFPQQYTYEFVEEPE